MSALEDDFLGLWQKRSPFLLLEREYSGIEAWEVDYQQRYAKSKRSKRYRLDFAHPASRIGIEIQGGCTCEDGTSLVLAMNEIAESIILPTPVAGPFSCLLPP